METLFPSTKNQALITVARGNIGIKLKKSIAELPEKQREVFLLSRIEKKKYSEISEMLDISVKAGEKRMSQALITMREQIGNV